MKVKCMGCGVCKDLSQLEVYPYHEEDSICDDPITPILEVDCQPYDYAPWKRVLVCHECFHRLSPDLWIHQWGWEKLNPVVPYHELPDLKKG